MVVRWSLLLRRALPVVGLAACTSVVPARPPPAPIVSSGATSPPVVASTSTAPPPAPVDEEAAAPVAEISASEGVGIAPGPAGHLGAWLALGPFRLDDAQPSKTSSFRPPVRDASGKIDPQQTIDDHAFAPKWGSTLPTFVDVPVRDVGKDGKPYGKPKKWTFAPATWSIVSSGEGAIDLEKTFASTGKPAVGYLGGVLRVPKAMRLVLLVGSDDGCEVIVDGKTVFERDAPRPQRDDDDLVPLDLAAGDHVVLFKLHQRDSGWAIRVRLVDRSFRPPLGVRLLLPDAKPDAAKSLARAMSWVRIVREPTSSGWAVSTLVRYPEGAPLGVPLEATGAVLEGDAAIVPPKPLGAVTIGPRGASELRAKIDDLGPEIDEKPRALSVRIDIAGRVVDGAFFPRRPVRLAIARARALLDAGVHDDVTATLDHLSERLATQVSRGDGDLVAQLADAKFLDAFAADVEAGADPIAKRTGPMRLAHVARADDRPQPVAVYVPKNAANKKLPLYVGLHGMNGGPMAMLRVFFGGDDEKKSMWELDRTMGPTPDIAAYVIAPHAHGNAMYRQLGEEEVLDAIAWARARWPGIDPDRIYLTGFSMGGIGAASIPLHHPDVFAASQPLCGYHSYFIRRDVAGRPRRPWEQHLLEDRSNVAWVDNGARLPLFVIHGKKDLPEENSGVLIEAYEKRGFSIKHDHPDLGHDVWGYAYDKLQHLDWFAGRRRNPHPKHVRFRTTRTRFGDDAWVHLDRLSSVADWATIDATVASASKIVVKTVGVDAFHLDRDDTLMKDELTVVVDGAAIPFAASVPLALHREGSTWAAGPPKVEDGPRKGGKITGPIRDVWNEPLIVVYGADDPLQTQANLEVAQALANIRWGVDVKYPVVKDSTIDPAAAPTKSMILVGNAKSNRVVRALEPLLPMKIDDAAGTLSFAGRVFSGSQLGAAFVVPHPKAPERYLLVVEGVDALGTFRALSLPELLPDFVVWDERLAPARSQTLLGFGSVLAAGYFDTSWKPPSTFDDPLAGKAAVPKNEKDATPYLP